LGVNGDFYLDTQANVLYGPKNGIAWPVNGTSLVGPSASFAGGGSLDVVCVIDATNGDGTSFTVNMGLSDPDGTTFRQGHFGPFAPGHIGQGTDFTTPTPAPYGTYLLTMDVSTVGTLSAADPVQANCHVVTSADVTYTLPALVAGSNVSGDQQVSIPFAYFSTGVI
jgi:hypothetical protein